MSSFEQIANDFVYLYYRKFVYGDEDIVKFYVQNALMTRPEYDVNEPKTLTDLRPDMIRTDIPTGTQFVVTDYKTKEIENGFELVVNAVIDNGSPKSFTQTFTIQKINENYFITKDIYEIKETKTFPDVKTGYIEVHQRSESRRSQSPRNNRGKVNEQRIKKNDKAMNEIKQKNKFSDWTPNSK
ncbi:hypothetical protein TVAG_100720 [Trichomonas vaginalis G3]|uniref:NTF2 domain-containing protein n=1 Tax=Trichomonas vaginalis (strain ATCC PRA-98 / G3) TaxID=412133 RepID=A2ENP9_TRIV3|nr:NTF2-like family [Trichomonas vaginalis G3]EAY05749.1 hypothetical protein TVAG_100720 [Trichomonas vaginalis G3]KAI5535138.1 NTF2-like family [Trichomonas vaginalis G3]|eukprot:XP_001317972.1 hypothetical protein [Trichomonas vaginalis G3]